MNIENKLRIIKINQKEDDSSSDSFVPLPEPKPIIKKNFRLKNKQNIEVLE